MKINVNSIVKIQDKFVNVWHKDNNIKPNNSNKFFKLILNQHYFNIKLWHLEDQARRYDIPDREIVKVKRMIDKANQRRNDYIEKIDNYIVKELKKIGLNNNGLPLHSETIGSIIDRLSILSLKVYHMHEETKRIDVNFNYTEICKKKLKILKQQRDDLAFCLKELFHELFSGEKRIKVYYQFKMYNNPKSNPAIYKKEKLR
jgi:hypothetical protein